MRSFRDALIIFIAAISILGYFMTSSAVNNPLKSYRYSLTRDELKKGLIQTIRTQHDLTFSLTDSTGTDKNDLNYYANIIIKKGTDEYEYKIKYNKEKSLWDNSVKSEISLIGAFDKVNKTGGYKTEDADIKKLINIFERELINKLDGKKKGNIDI